MTSIAQRQAIGSRFSAAADTYDEHAHVQQRVADRLIEFMPGQTAPRRILEVGCGTGILTTRLARSFPRAEILAIDIAVGLVEEARRRLAEHGNVTCSEADVMKFRADKAFDLIVSSSSLHWISPFGELFTRLARHATEDGSVYFAMMLNGTLRELHESRSRAVSHKQAISALPDEDTVTRSMSESGLRIVRHTVETIVQEFSSAQELLTHLHELGVTGGPVSSSGRPLLRAELKTLMRDYEDNYSNSDGSVYATYRTMYAHCTPTRRLPVE